MRAPLLALVVLVGCGASSPVGSTRFANAPAVWRVNDRLDVAKPPRVIPFLRWFYDFSSYYHAAVRGLRLDPERRALGVNALDEVPDSTWFTNRLGVREMSPDEIRKGPAQAESPELHRPWTIKSSKVGGTSPGLICDDAQGTTFLLKFDQPTIPELETATDVIVDRLLWAAGWNVPTDYVVYFDRQDLVLGSDAKYVTKHAKRALTEADVDRLLASIAGQRTAHIRGLASIYVGGKPIGGTPLAGTRRDDINDRIPHERRRDQRGFGTFAAWLGHNDLKFDNTLDSWQQDPADPSRHYVVHYEIDFGKALGAMAQISGRAWVDYSYRIDLHEMLSSLFTLGIRRHAWEERRDPGIRGVGMFGATDYDPAGFKPNNMTYTAVRLADRFDQFWASKIMIRFSREQLAAAVDAARFSDPAAATYLVDTLVERQRRTARFWFSRVAPIADVTTEGAATGLRLCFTDLAVQHGLAAPPATYGAKVFTDRGARLGSLAAGAGERGRVCFEHVPLATGPERYTVVRVEGPRGTPPVLLHVALDPATHTPRVIGVDRR